MKFAFVGMAEVEDVDVVVTLMSDMVGDCEESIIDNIIMLGEHGITVETANDDIYQITVATDAACLYPVWTSGKVASDESLHIRV